MDRLRLLRDNAACTARQVFILSSVPRDITVNHLWGWKRPQSLLGLWNEADGLLPLNAKHMMVRCPLSATSVSTAERLAKELKTLSFLISTYIRGLKVYTVTYRTKGQKRPSEALVTSDWVIEDIIRTLSELADEPVEVDPARINNY